MAQTQNKNYLNGIFPKKKTGSYGDFFNIGIKKGEFIKHLQSLKEDERGFVNLVMSEQKNDPSKYSVYEDTWKPTARVADNSIPNHRTPATDAIMANGLDDLPF